MVIFGEILIAIGALFLFLGALGIVRMPDVYNRLQAGTKASTLGAMLIFLGVGVADRSYLLKSLLLLFFTVLGNPIVSSLIARSAHRSNVKMVGSTKFDKYSADYGNDTSVSEVEE